MSERWDRIKELYQEALARDPESRLAYLDAVCADEDLRREVQELLHYDSHADAKGFLDQAALELSRPERNSILSTLESGQIIGPYQITVLLGEGGMGQVYDATDLRLGRRVALKLLRMEIANSPDARRRFLREARSAAALNHPNIATIYDAGEAQGRLYLTMEFIEGESLRSLLSKGALSEPEVVSHATQLASALEHAHSRGILHRDIKPGNLIVENSGGLKLVDFGIAKPAQGPNDETRTGITTPGMFVGTLRYAPPEVLSDNPATRQSDLYSFGVVLYEMLCGQTPFEGLSEIALVGAILKGEAPSIRVVNGAVSEALARVVERCMARDPAARFSSASDVLAGLRDLGNVDSLRAPETQSLAKPSLVILEFANLSQDASLDWLGTGIVETLDADLRKMGLAQIVGRARTQQAIRGLGLNTGETGGLIALGNRLGAKWIITGSFQRSGNRIRVTPKVFKVSEGEAVAAQKIDGVWEDLFEVQDRVVAELMRSLELESDPSKHARPSPAAARQLDAYEHYSNGRRLWAQLNRESLVKAVEHFQQAVNLDPNYALAHSGLGSVHALGFIQTSNPDQLQLARRSLERAIDLDAELGEPYAWLCYLYFRLGDAAKCLRMGEKAVQLQPDLAHAHYFYSAVLMSTVERGLGSYQQSMDRIINGLLLDPRMGQQWMIAGSGALLTGQYLAAQRCFENALQLERIPDIPRKFIGAQTMLGFLHTRQRLWDSARRHHADSIESLRGVTHVYSGVFTALSACGLGEIEVRAGRFPEALTHFRHAWRLVKEDPRMLGSIRLSIRSQTGMASAYAAAGERDKAEQHLAEAVSRLPSVDLGSSTFDTPLAQLHYSIAGAQLRLGLADEALTSLNSAIDTGLADGYWLENDLEWTALRDHDDYKRLLERLRLMPPVRIELSRFSVLDFSASNAAS